MCKRIVLLMFLFTFVGIAAAEDLVIPSFSGCGNTGTTAWEFDVDPVLGEELYLTEPGDEGPTDFVFDPPLEEYGFSVWPSYGEVSWNEEEQSLYIGEDETGFYMPIPDGDGAYLTLYCQITTSEYGEIWPMLETWDVPSREGEYLGGIEGDELDYWGEPVEIEEGVFHTYFYVTLWEGSAEAPYVNVLIWWEDIEVYEVVLDAHVHEDPEPEECPGGVRPGGEVPPQVSDEAPTGTINTTEDVNLSFYAPANAYGPEQLYAGSVYVLGLLGRNRPEHKQHDVNKSSGSMVPEPGRCQRPTGSRWSS
jgi:hypothetical protein